jgi:isoamylase
VRWLSPTGQDIEDQQWGDTNARCFGMLLDGRAQASGIKRPAMDATALLVLNAHHDVVNFVLPDVVGGSVWRCLLDTNIPEDSNHQAFNTGDGYEITGRSLVLFVLEPESKRSVALRRAIEGFRLMAERPIPVATPETGPEAERAFSP